MTGAARTWRYRAEDARGAVVMGHIEAESERAATGRLVALRLTPLSLRPAALKRIFGRGGNLRKLSISDLALITRRLETLLRGGLPLAYALRLAAQQASNAKEGAFFEYLLNSVRKGTSLSAAAAQSGFEAPRLFLALIAAGESSGQLSQQSERLAAHYHEVLARRREIASQLAYPVALVVLIVATLLFLSFFILPQFESIFATADASPPPETAFVLAAGAFIRAEWLAILAVILLLIAALRFAARRFQSLFELVRLRMPVFGKLLALNEFGAYFQTLATLLSCGAPLARAMPLARDAVSLRALRDKLESAEKAVRIGGRLASALTHNVDVPVELTAYIEIGEETGELAALAAQAAGHANSQVRTAVTRIMVLLAPALTAIMGLVTAAIIAAVMSGVLSLNDTVY